MKPPVQKNFLFDVLLPRVEWLAWLLASAGVALAYFSYPRANIFIFLGFSTLAAVYFLSSFAPSARARAWAYQIDYKQVIPEEKSFLTHALIPHIQGKAMAITLIGIQFKLLFLPGYGTLLLVGLSIMATIAAIQLATNSLSRKLLIIIALGVTVAYVPLDSLVRQFYQHGPALAEKMIYHLQHPKDEAAAEEVRRLQKARQAH